MNGPAEPRFAGTAPSTLPPEVPATASSRHLVALDGLRGIAAIWVVFHHLHLLSSRGYLAVDFFFCLSGYIIGLAYEKRLQAGLSVGEYMKIRLIRLYPMLLLGGLLGLGLALAGGNPLAKQTLAESPHIYWSAVAGQFLLIPYVVPITAFLFNSPQWSILFELAINFLHALLLRWLSVRVLVGIVAVSAVALVFIAHDRDDLSLGANLVTLLPAVPRVTFGFTAGVLLFRLRDRWLPYMRSVPFWLIALLLILSFSVPTIPLPGLRTGGRAAFTIIVLYPLVVAAGAKCSSGGGGAVALGLLSYPIYAIHYPLVELAQTWIGTHVAVGDRLTPILVKLSAAAAAILMALALGKWAELPLMDWRRRKLVTARGQTAVGTR